MGRPKNAGRLLVLEGGKKKLKKHFDRLRRMC